MANTCKSENRRLQDRILDKLEKLDRKGSELDIYLEKIHIIANSTPFYLEGGYININLFNKILKLQEENDLPKWITDIGENYCVMLDTLFIVMDLNEELGSILNRNYPDVKFLKENLENDLQNKIREMVYKYKIIEGKYISEEVEEYDSVCVGKKS